MGPNGSKYRVTLSKPFYAGVTEVTLGQYRRFKPGHKVEGADDEFNEDDRPAAMVSWDDARGSATWLSAQDDEKKAGRVYALPTEAQWEWAARAGTATARYFGETDKDQAKFSWFNVTYTPNPKTETKGRGRQPVGEAAAERLGTVRHAGQRVGVVRRPPHRRGDGRDPRPGDAGRVVAVGGVPLHRRRPRPRLARHEGRQHRLPRRRHRHTNEVESSLLLGRGGRRIGFDFEFQLPGGELAQNGVELDLPVRESPRPARTGAGTSPFRTRSGPGFVLHASLAGERDVQFVELDFLPRCQCSLPLAGSNPERATPSRGTACPRHPSRRAGSR